MVCCERVWQISECVRGEGCEAEKTREVNEGGSWVELLFSVLLLREFFVRSILIVEYNWPFCLNSCARARVWFAVNGAQQSVP